MTVTIKKERCIGCGMCAAAVPGVFVMEGSISTVPIQPGCEEQTRVFDAANGCPVNAIVVTR